MSHKLWLILSASFVPMVCLASIDNSWRRPPDKPATVLTERTHWKTAVRNARFADVPQAAGRQRCQISQVPEALTTPDPLLESTELLKVTISFIVGTDGRVHSAYIVESGGWKEDRTVLQTVRAWRYRPAMCNGIPTEAEGRIQFSIR